MTPATDDIIFKPRRLGHVNLWVGELGRSERFYNAVCGLTVEFTEPSLVASFLGTGHTPHDLGMIEKTNGEARYGRDGLLQLPPGIGLNVGLNHLAWELENEAELVAGYKRLKEKGIPTDITVDHQVAHSVYMFDPDMNYIEFYCDTVRDWRKVLQGPMDLITAEWDPLTAEGFREGRYEVNPTIREVPEAPLHPRRITHAVIETPDVARLVDFYQTVGGLRVVGWEWDGALALLAGAHADYRFNLAICKADRAAYHHASFELQDEAALDAAAADLRKRGIAIDRQVETAWKRSFFLRDPDGLLSEFYVLRPAPRGNVDKHDLALAFLV